MRNARRAKIAVGRRALVVASAALSNLGASERQKTIFFIRHGQSVANAAGPDKVATDLLYYDAQLTPQGCAQASSWRAQAPEWEVDLVVVSPLTRALQTAAFIFQDTPSPMLLTPNAREGWWKDAENRGRLAAGLLTGTRHGRLGEAVLWPKLGELPGFDGGLSRLEGLSVLETPCAKRWHPEEEARLALQEGGPELLQEKWQRESLSGLLHELGELEAERVAVVCHWGVISSLLGVDARNCDLIETRFSQSALTQLGASWRASTGGAEPAGVSSVASWKHADY